MFKDKTKLKGQKFYATAGSLDGLYYTSKDIETAKKGLDSNYTPYLVEVTVTRVFVREQDLKEIETEIN